MKNSIVAGTLVFFVASCTKNSSNDSAVKEQVSPIESSSLSEPFVDCQNGLTPISLALMSTDLEVDVNSLVNLLNKETKISRPNQAKNVRIDVCTDFGQVGEIRQFVAVLPELASPILIRDLAPDIRSQGIKLLFSSDLLGVNIQLKISDTQTLILAGARASGNADGKLLVAGIAEGTSSIISNTVISGTLEIGNPFNICFGSVGGEKSVDRIFKIGTAEFKIKMCVGGKGSSGTFAYDVKNIEITDSSEQLGLLKNQTRKVDSSEISTVSGFNVVSKQSEAKEDSFVLENMKPGQALTTSNHHNICDVLYVKFEEVTYALTNVGGIGNSFGCSIPTEFPRIQNERKARYRISYGNGDVIEDTASFFNYYR